MSENVRHNISYKFGGLLSGTFVVNAAELYTAGIDQHLGYFISRGTTFMFRHYSLGSDTAMLVGLYAGFATHF